MRVWHAEASENDPGEVERLCESWLDVQDRDRAQRLRRMTTRNQHVVGRGMMRRLLSDSCEAAIHPQSIRFATLAHGKPYVSAPDEVCRPFNVSHTSGLVVGSIVDSHELLATDELSGDTLLGVDVERIDRRTDVNIAERYFSRPEIQYVHSHQCEASRRVAFLKVWTLKESFIKAIGTGLQTPLADFAFRDIDTDSPWIEMLDPKLERAVTWKFFPLVPRPGFLAAVAVACQSIETTVQVEVRGFEELILPRTTSV